MKNEALKLADDLKCILQLPLVEQHQTLYHAEAMIRRLVEELNRLDYDLKALVKLYKELNKTKPLSDEEIVTILKNVNLFDMKAVVRAIEERHGIK